MNKHYVAADVDPSIEPYDVPEEAAVCAAICAILLDRAGVDYRPAPWLGDLNAAPAAVSNPVADDDHPPLSLWRSVLASFFGGFGAYGLALHPVAGIAILADRAGADRPAWHRRALASIAHAAGAFRDRWRRERDIRRAVAALALLDDHTLRDMGIQGRAEIERVVRYCHDC